jgi:assimilatory nitrate reductase catalytic subunit
MYHSTETAQRADLLLPAAGWGEKEGTFINSERRLGVIKRIARAPGQALADFSIFRLIADAWGCGPAFRDWNSPSAVFQILKRLSRGQPCDITGIADYRTLEERGGVQWPAAEGTVDDRPQRRLFEDGRFYHPDGRARFVCEDPQPLRETPDANYPLLLLTGRGSVSQWHTQTRTAKSAVLRKLSPQEPYVEMHPADARELGIRAGDRVIVASRRGRIEVRAFLAPTVARGQVFVSMHYAAANRLTDAVFDPYSGQPAYKACAVRVELPGGRDAGSA